MFCPTMIQARLWSLCSPVKTEEWAPQQHGAGVSGSLWAPAFCVGPSEVQTGIWWLSQNHTEQVTMPTENCAQPERNKCVEFHWSRFDSRDETFIGYCFGLEVIICPFWAMFHLQENGAWLFRRPHPGRVSEGSDEGYIENASHVQPEEGPGLCHQRDKAPHHGLLSPWLETPYVKVQSDCSYLGKVKSEERFQKIGSWLTAAKDTLEMPGLELQSQMLRYCCDCPPRCKGKYAHDNWKCRISSGEMKTTRDKIFRNNTMSGTKYLA